MSQGALTAIVKRLDAAGQPRTFPAVQAALEAAAAGPQPQQALVDLAARLKTVTEASVEAHLRPGPAALHLEAAIRAGQPVLFSVPVPRLRLVGEKLGAWLLAECNRVASRLTATHWGRKTGRRCLVLVDEFAGLREQGAHAAEPLATVREGGVSVWLFTQTCSDLERLGDNTRSSGRIGAHPSRCGRYPRRAPVYGSSGAPSSQGTPNRASERRSYGDASPRSYRQTTDPSAGTTARSE
jgi:hypothetical protein